jgi:membrane protein
MAEEKQAKLQQLQSQMRQLMDDDAIAEQEHKLSWAQRLVHFWILAGQNFLKNRGPARAASLAYTTLLALVPLLAVSISVAALFLPRDEGKQKEELVTWINAAVEKFAPSIGVTTDFRAGSLTNALPRGATNSVGATAPSLSAEEQRAQLADKIVEFVGNIRFGTIGATAMAGLIFVAISLLRNIEAGFNDMWGVTKGRGWMMSIVVYWAAITLGPVVIVMVKGASYLQALAKTPELLPAWIPGQVVLSLAWVPALAVSSLAFGALYLWMPNTRVRWSAALVGGFVAASLWMLNGRMAALYNTRVLTYNAIYGSLGILPLFLLGLYLSWLILLFGAQVAYVFQFRKAYLQERQAGRVNQQAREFVALRFMAEIGRRFQAEAKPLTATASAELFGVPPKLTKDILTLLVNGRLLVETTSGETAYTPARPLVQISVRDILRAIRSGSGSDLATHDDYARAVVRGEFEAVLAAEDSRATTVSLQELVARIPAPTTPKAA